MAGVMRPEPKRARDPLATGTISFSLRVLSVGAPPRERPEHGAAVAPRHTRRACLGEESKWQGLHADGRVRRGV